jgi:precorrin-4/cobalt-precorrin-4 C11-methyltransferase
MIYIIGIGPGGSPDHLTSRARQVMSTLRGAVYVGEMIGPGIRSLLPPDRLRTGDIAASEVLASIRAAATAGSDFAVLVPGDPCLYSGQHGRELSVGQYVEWLRAEGIPFEVVPGISSWMALCAAAGVDMTSFGGSQGILVLSMERMASESGDGRLDTAKLEACLRHRPSLALFQSYACRFEVAELLRAHYPQDTEVILGYRVSWPGERILRMPLSALDPAALGDDMARHSTILVLSRPPKA